MDDYPEHLAPKFKEGGSVKESFEEWWKKVEIHYPQIPEEVARYWLYEHWGYSPFRWLPSNRYNFKLFDFPSCDLIKIRSEIGNFKKNNKCMEYGNYLLKNNSNAFVNSTSKFMINAHDFPTPIVVIDNRDGHLDNSEHFIMNDFPNYPRKFILVEGHKRLSIAVCLAKAGKFKEIVQVYIMNII